MCASSLRENPIDFNVRGESVVFYASKPRERGMVDECLCRGAIVPNLPGGEHPEGLRGRFAVLEMSEKAQGAFARVVCGIGLT